MERIEPNNIPKNLYGKCFKDYNLCLICQKKYDEYKNNQVLIWDEIPENCMLSGWIFLQREKIKQKIRRKKEKVLSLKIKVNSVDGIKLKRILKDIVKYQKEIDVYKEYGSQVW